MGCLIELKLYEVSLILKVSAFYLGKQKSFIPKKIFSSRCQYQNKKLCLLAQFSGKILVQCAKSECQGVKECTQELDYGKYRTDRDCNFTFEFLNLKLLQSHLL